jgi:hypothetical protein
MVKESVRSIALQFFLRWKRPKFNFIAIATILFVFMGIARFPAFANSCCVAKCLALIHPGLTDARAMCPTWCESPAYQAWSADACAESSNSQPATTSKSQTKSSASRTNASATTKTPNSERIKKQAKSSTQPASGPPAGAPAVHETSGNANAASGSPTATLPTPTPTPTESPPTSPRDVNEGNLRKKDQASQSTSAATSASSAPSQQAASVTQSQNDPVHLQLPLNADQVAAKIQQCNVQKCTCSSFLVSKVPVIDVYRICDEKCSLGRLDIQCFEDCSNDWKAYNDKANAYNKRSKQVCPKNYSDN